METHLTLTLNGNLQPQRITLHPMAGSHAASPTNSYIQHLQGTACYAAPGWSPLPVCPFSLVGKSLKRPQSWFSLKHIYFTFIEYKNSEHTRIHHRALKRSMTGGGRRRKREKGN